MNAAILLGKSPNLKPPSATVMRLLMLLDAPDADLDEVIAIVGRDAVLSAKLLAVCNSAGYGLAHPVASLDQAVLYVGFGEMHRLVMALSLGGTMAGALPGYDMVAGELWRHSLVTALLSPRVLARAGLPAAEGPIAYTAALVHDIGKTVIGQLPDPEAYAAIRRLVDERGHSLLEAEHAVLGCDHAEIGARLLQQWRLPEIIVEAVAAHHDPRPETGRLLASVVHVADALAHQCGASPGLDSFAVVHHESAISALQLTASDLEALSLEAVDCLEKARQQENLNHAASPARGSKGVA